MDYYEPPFEITNRMLSQISAISEKLGMIAAYRSLDTKPQLRRNNRIKSVHSSLRIESSSLSEGMVRSVLNNRAVIGPEKEIQEVKNAFAAYDYIFLLKMRGFLLLLLDICILIVFGFQVLLKGMGARMTY